MKRTYRFLNVCGVVIICGICLASGSASAERKNLLEGQPAVRHRQELRDGRFEIGPSFGITLNRALRHSVLFGLKLEYHIIDMLSLGADFGFGVGFDSGMANELKAQCPAEGCLGGASDPNGKKGSDNMIEDDIKPWSEHEKLFSNIKMAGDVRLTFTPFSGKLGIFSKLFLGYDMYVFGGVGMALLSNSYEGSNKTLDDVSQGFRVGPAFGIGAHLFFNQFISLGFDVKDLIFLDNQDSGDMTRGLQPDELSSGKTLVNSDDQKFTGHWIFGLNLTFFLPTTVNISP